jgi:S-adenosyl-L-methionine hydrolase (adenosine-forming)
MTIVTLTTDFGWQDYYVPAIKGAMLKLYQSLNIVDVTHQIKHHDIVQAAFILSNSWDNFPTGTIHVVSVNNFSSEKLRFLAIEHQGHYFLCPDNGIFSLMFEVRDNRVGDSEIKAYELPFPGLGIMPIRDMIARAVEHIASGKEMTEIGALATEMVQRISFQPVISTAQIRGTVIHIDHYDNAIININKTLFEKVGKGREFALYFRRHDPILGLSMHYNDVPIGETLCLFNNDYLEIAINMGKAAEMLGLKVEDTVQIDFSQHD